MLGFSWLVEWSGSRIVGLSRREFLQVAGLTAVGVTIRRYLGSLAQRAAAEDGAAWVFGSTGSPTDEGLVFPAYFVPGAPIIDPTAVPTPTTAPTLTPQRTYLPTVLKGDE